MENRSTAYRLWRLRRLSKQQDKSMADLMKFACLLRRIYPSSFEIYKYIHKLTLFKKNGNQKNGLLPFFWEF